MAHSSVYTRTGDDGSTGLLGGVRGSKADPIFEVLGDLDELNASLGLANSYLKSESTKFYSDLEDYIGGVQVTLLDIGAVIGGFDENLVSDMNQKIVEMEHHIDRIDSQLQPLKNFILPGGNIIAANIHMSRTICRRVERHMVALQDHRFVPYINRLSDYLFVVARQINNHTYVPDILYKRH